MLVHLFMRVVPLQILVKAVPIKQGHTLRILFPITPNVRRYKEGPCRYISHLIGHEGEGSLFYILKKLGKLSFCGLCCSLGIFTSCQKREKTCVCLGFWVGLPPCMLVLNLLCPSSESIYHVHVIPRALILFLYFILCYIYLQYAWMNKCGYVFVCFIPVSVIVLHTKLIMK